MDVAHIVNVLIGYIALVFSLCIHEASHAYSAKWLGDPTAELEGRLTLNPIAHMDMVGTIILPLSAAFFGFPFIIGWAKPVPVNIHNLKDSKWGYVLVSAAGPAANLFFCAFWLILLIIYQNFFSNLLEPGTFFYPLVKLLISLVWINIILAVFNLIPLPPLDGAAVFAAVLPVSMKEMYDLYIVPYGGFLLILLIITGGLGWITKIAGLYIGVLSILFQSVLNLFI